ncbi:MAG: uridine kinase [Flavobacteriaceae bacterium]
MQRMFIIGITGGSGSGKSSIVNAIAEGFDKNQLTVLSQDRYYNPLDHLSSEERSVRNFDHPSAFDYDLLEKHLQELKKGNTIPAPVYSFVKETRESETDPISPTPILLLEGILLMNHPKIKSMVDLWIYIDTDEDHRLMRRVLRDTAERGQELTKVFRRYTEQVKPMHQNYIEASKSEADIIINNNHHYDRSVQFVIKAIQQMV